MYRLAYNERVEWLARVAQCSLHLLVILKTLVYYGFNKQFRRTLNSFFITGLYLFRSVYSCKTRFALQECQSRSLIEPLSYKILNNLKFKFFEKQVDNIQNLYLIVNR
jgi:hypothetical protein